MAFTFLNFVEPPPLFLDLAALRIIFNIYKDNNKTTCTYSKSKDYNKILRLVIYRHYCSGPGLLKDIRYFYIESAEGPHRIVNYCGKVYTEELQAHFYSYSD